MQVAEECAANVNGRNHDAISRVSAEAWTPGDRAMRDLILIEQLRMTAAFKAFDPSSTHLVTLLRDAANRLEHLTGERPFSTLAPCQPRGQHEGSAA